MEKKNKDPLLKQPVLMVKKVFIDGSSVRPAGDAQVEQPLDAQEELKKAAAQVLKGAGAGSLEDLRTGTSLVTGVVNVLSGGDPMRPVRERATNADALPGAMQEVIRFLPILSSEHPGLTERLDLGRAQSNMELRDHARQMQAMYQGRANEMDALARQYESETAPTLVAVFNGCRPTIEQHAVLKDNMPELTRLAVGAQQDAALNRAANDKLRAQSATNAGPQPASLASTPAPAVTTTVTTPAAPPPISVPVPAPAPRHPAPRSPKR